MGALTIAPADLQQAMSFCKIMSESNFVPQTYRNKPGDILAAVTMGAELGLGPMQSLLGIAVINGKPSIYGDTLLSLVLNHPDCEDVIETIENEGTDKALARCEVRRRGRQPAVRTFSVDDAKRARLWGKKGPWTDYPLVMLKHRARGFALRDTFADALAGLVSTEEAGDYKTAPTSKAKAKPKAKAECTPGEPTVITADAVEVKASELPARPKISDDILRALAHFESIGMDDQTVIAHLEVESIDQIKPEHLDNLRAYARSMKESK
tara:strand:+ start:105 stop:905 length:801 start_codon:yes stop_codon:yes gene_type:complete